MFNPDAVHFLAFALAGQALLSFLKKKVTKEFKALQKWTKF